MTAHERLHLLYDNGFYDELFRSSNTARPPSAWPGRNCPPTAWSPGWGRSGDGWCSFASQDFTVMGGSVGWMHAWKICEVMDMALKAGAPVRRHQ